jgi:hypothetical protein
VLRDRAKRLKRYFLWVRNVVGHFEMKYQIPEDFKPKAIKRNRMALTIQYSIGILVAAYFLLNNWNSAGLELKLPLLSLIIACPIAWVYFDRSFQSLMTLTYEVTDTHLLRIVDEEVKSKFLLKSIYDVKEAANGLKVKSESETFIIPNSIDGLTELMEKIKAVANTH